MFAEVHRRNHILALCTSLVLAGGITWAVACQDWSSESNWTKRDKWQRPQEVMDELGLSTGSAVADIGAGRGYFTVRLAERVGPSGKVYAVDISERDLERIGRRARESQLLQIETVHGVRNDPRLAVDSVDAILVVNAYHEMREYDDMLQGMLRALRPSGRLAIIDQAAEPGESRERYHSRHRIPEPLVREDAERNGFRFLRRPPGFQDADGDNWFFLLFEKPAS